jgi:hypothetical protein
MPKWEVQTSFSYGWDNCWSLDGEPWLFDSWQEAFEELLEFFEDLNQAGMISNYSLTDYRIVELTNTAPEETIPS